MRGRPFGSKDHYKRRRGHDRDKRKPRSDRKYPYVKRQGEWFRKRIRIEPRKTVLKIYFWEQREMNYDSYMRWTRHSRARMKRVVYKPFMRVDLPIEYISSVAAIQETALEVIGCTGTFIMRGFTKGKYYNKKNKEVRQRVRQIRLAVITIKEHSHGMRAYVSDYSRISRYWFWNKM